jgi:uncharacterized RDD family membrane protein YckC
MSDAPPPPPPPPSGGSWQAPPPPGVTGGAALASWGQRVGAYLLNAVFILVGFIAVMIVSVILGAVAEVFGVLVALVGNLAAFAAAIWFYWLDGETGASPGKRVLGLRTVKTETGQPIGGGMGIVRAIAHIVDQIPCYLGFLWPVWDDKRQTFADKLVGTVVVSGQPKRDLGPDLFTR